MKSPHPVPIDILETIDVSLHHVTHSDQRVEVVVQWHLRVSQALPCGLSSFGEYS